MSNQNEFPHIIADFQKDEPYFLNHLSKTCINEGAHRSNYYSISFLSKGELLVETNLFKHHAKAPALFVIAPDVIRQFYEVNGEVCLTALFFKKEYFLKGQVNIHFLEKYDFLQQKDQHIIALNEQNAQSFSNYFSLIEKKINIKSSHSSDITRSFIYILLNEINEISENRETSQTITLSRNEQLLLDFKTLLSAHFKKNRQLDFYAEKLFVTSKHLSSAVKEVSGKTARDWVNEMLILESKVLLKDNKVTIAQVADRLEFVDPSHFGKFFKRHTGISPLQFKNG